MFAQSLVEYGALTGALDRVVQSFGDVVRNAAPQTWVVSGVLVLFLVCWFTRRR